jgi:hypothetical protein
MTTDTADLSVRALTLWERGLDWLTTHLPHFLPTDLSEPEHLQSIGELSLLYGLTHSWSTPSTAHKLDPIVEFLADFLSDPCVVQYARKLPAHYNPYFVTYLPFRMSDRRLAGFEEALSAVRRIGYPRAIETTPYRQLEIEYLLWKAGLRRRPPSWGYAYRATVLHRCRNPIYLTMWDAYSITHTLFYLTDFAGPACVVPSSVLGKAPLFIETLLIHYWRRSNWDLVGELLLNLIALDRFRTPLFIAAATALMSAWCGDGALPGPGSDADQGAPDDHHFFMHCYHTTLVGVLLCGAYLYRTAGSIESHVRVSS